MHTEEEAKKKWCPIRAKINATLDMAADCSDMGENTPNPDNCLGSDCIEWQSLDILSMLNAIPYNDNDAPAFGRFYSKARQMIKEGVFKSVGHCGVRNVT